jgi:hypothetical protein
MNKFISLFLIFIFIMTISVFAQEEESGMHMTPPPPLKDEFMNWMVGEWEGYSKSEMGKSKDKLIYKMDLGGQFLVMHFTAEREGGVMTGMGMITHTEDGKYKGYWIDSWRTMSEGKGNRDGDISTMEWSTSQGVFVRKTERVDANTMKVFGLMKGADGSEIHSESEYNRVN